MSHDDCPGVITTSSKFFVDVHDVMEIIGCKRSKAYRIIASLRKELFAKHLLTPELPAGMCPKKYFYQRLMILEKEELEEL